MFHVSGLFIYLFFPFYFNYYRFTYEPEVDIKPLSYNLNQDVVDSIDSKTQDYEGDSAGEEEASDEEESEDEDNYSDLATSDEEDKAEDTAEESKLQKKAPIKKKESKSEIPFVFKGEIV